MGAAHFVSLVAAVSSSFRPLSGGVCCGWRPVETGTAGPT